MNKYIKLLLILHAFIRRGFVFCADKVKPGRWLSNPQKVSCSLHLVSVTDKSNSL